MKKRMIFAGPILAAQILGSAGALAGPFEDGMAAYNRGDYMPAIRLFRPLAGQGNARAQHLIGVMYHRGEGVARNPVRGTRYGGGMETLSVTVKVDQAGGRQGQSQSQS